MWYWCTVKNVPPWELRGEGDERFPEDLVAIKKMDEYHTDRQNMNAKKGSKGGSRTTSRHRKG